MQAFVARQPIFDRHKKVWGYEILYRSNPKDTTACISDHNEASFTVLHHLLMVMDINELTHHTRAFINFTQSLLIQDIASLLPPDQTVVEILETTIPDEQTLGACETLKRMGYTIAVDDFVLEAVHLRPFVALADIVKIDCLHTPPHLWQSLIASHRTPKKRFLAEKLETHDDFVQALEAGFDFFQGFFFSRPVVVSRCDIPPMASSLMKMMTEIVHQATSLEEIEKIIKKDPGMTYKLLRYINSPAVGLRTPVSSLRRALMLLGEREVRRWILLVLHAGIAENKAYNLFEVSLQRARFMELLAQEISLPPESAFLVGLFSLLDAILECPIEVALAALPLDRALKDALTSRQEGGTLGALYKMVLDHEAGRWEDVTNFCTRHKITTERVNTLYLASLKWVHQLA